MCDHENDCMDWSDEDYFLCKVSAGFPHCSQKSFWVAFFSIFDGKCNELFSQTNTTGLETFAQTPCAENEFHCVKGDRYQISKNCG